MLSEAQTNRVWQGMISAEIRAKYFVQKAFDCSNLHERWSRLHQSYRSIWEDTESADAPALLQELDSRQIEISKSSVPLPYDKKATGKWQTQTEREYGLAAVA